ncbi:MAG TPA: hypothetical protein VNU84_04805 [Candidatus Acidoferrum sp.]|jgi:hypothetical protein|nr:hypothetical protein [Candidatus Acidoferrum sp.]
MAQTIMIFDFGTNEEAAQQARHKIEGWKQGFRLGDKMTVKFEREDTAAAADTEDAEAEEESRQAKKSAAKKGPAKKAKEKENSGGRVRLLVRLGFSDHEKLSQQRWLDRIPAEEPFKTAKGETIRHGDPEFAKSAERFESLD